jgi:catechol 2,3-dioxygenase-like lactoylglutathione lyase family enzyme
MFSHIMVGSSNIEASKKFYDAVFAALDVKPGFTDDKGRVFWRTKSGVFAISKPIDGKPATFANGGTIGFAVDSAEKGAAWHQAGLTNGGKTCEDAPGWREGAMGKMYLAYLRDPDGNKICVLHRPS